VKEPFSGGGGGSSSDRVGGGGSGSTYNFSSRIDLCA